MRTDFTRWRRAALEGVALALILLLAAYLRLVNQPDNPGWYTDEATHLDIAHHLLRGQIRYMAIQHSTLLFGRMPLFDMALAGLLRLWGEGIVTLRVFTGVLGVISVALLYGIIRRTREDRDPALALLAAFMLAVYPQAVLYSRFGFSYNFLQPLVLLSFICLQVYLDSSRLRWLLVAALAVGLGSVSDLIMLGLVVPLVLTAASRRLDQAVLGGGLAVLPIVVYALVMLAIAPQALGFDVQFTLARLGGTPLTAQLESVARNYTILVFQDAWIAVGLLGLFALRLIRWRWLSLLFFFTPIVLVGRTVALHSLSFYYMIPFLPFVALGVASVVRHGVPVAWRAMRSTLHAFAARRGWPPRPLAAGAGVMLLPIVVVPFMVSTALTVERAQGRFGTGIDAFLIDPADARRAAAYLNERVRASDTVIASPAVGWLLESQVADFQMAAAASGQATVHLPANIPADRFAFDARHTQARFVVVDNLWRNWGALHMPAVADMLREVETWPPSYQSGQVIIYSNPTH